MEEPTNELPDDLFAIDHSTWLEDITRMTKLITEGDDTGTNTAGKELSRIYASNHESAAYALAVADQALQLAVHHAAFTMHPRQLPTILRRLTQATHTVRYRTLQWEADDLEQTAARLREGRAGEG